MTVDQAFKDAVLLGAKLRLEGADHKNIESETGLTYGRVVNYYYGGVLPAGFAKIFTEEELALIRSANKYTKRFSMTPIPKPRS